MITSSVELGPENDRACKAQQQLHEYITDLASHQGAPPKRRKPLISDR